MTDMNIQTDHVLWQQLSEINSALELLHDRRAILKTLEGLRASTRTLLNDHEVSRHPFISKGVRAIELCLEPFYDSIIAHDIQAFSAYHASKLRRTTENWGEFVDWQLSGGMPVDEATPVEAYQKAIAKAVPPAESWETLAAWGVDTNRADHLMMAKAHEQYLQLYEDYEGLSGSLAQAIASAMVRMPTATWIKVDDRDAYNRPRGYLRLGDLDKTDALLDRLLSPIGWSDVREYGLGPPPFHLIGELLLSTQRLGIPIKGLDIATPPPTGSPSTSNTATIHEPAVIRAAVKQLKTVTFRPRTNIWAQHWTKRAPEEWVHFTDFLLNLLHTKSLQRIDLSFYFMGTDDPPPLLSMASLLLSYTWPNLQDLYFNGPFHFKELQAVVKPLGRNVTLQWCGYLMSGLWVDVLDFLRERNARSQELGDVNGSIYGQECGWMTKIERDFIFKHDIWLKSRATQYIRGWVPSNPKYWAA
ncbi:hypothetical protein F5B21DRAFT_516722 [Xylaria acuta]|nr:hypothetical protein F5B21DRAFT_516722 [Xylaria acuta]